MINIVPFGTVIIEKILVNIKLRVYSRPLGSKYNKKKIKFKKLMIEYNISPNHVPMVLSSFCWHLEKYLIIKQCII